MHDVKVKCFAADYVSALQLTSLSFYIIDAEESKNDVSGDTEDVSRTSILNAPVKVRVSQNLEFEFQTSGCKEIAPSPYRRLAAISLQPLVSKLFIY